LASAFQVVLDELGAQKQVSNEAGGRRRLEVEGVLHGADRSVVVDVGADAADPLGEERRIPGVAVLENSFDAPEHHPGAPGVHDPVLLHLHLDAQVALDAGDGVDDLSRHGR
jgi:hypothetical protein